MSISAQRLVMVRSSSPQKTAERCNGDLEGERRVRQKSNRSVGGHRGKDA